MYWIPEGRSIIRKFVFNCSICEKNEDKPYSYLQRNSNLPKERLFEGHAFLNVSIDYACSLYVKNIYNSDSNDIYKACLVINTCAWRRGIYLDIVPDCSKCCIKVLGRFISYAVCPQVIISDNGKYFTRTCFTRMLGLYK